MFHPEVIARSERALAKTFAHTPRRRTLDERWAMRDQLRSAEPVKKGEPPARPLTTAESAFILDETLLGKIDYRYWSDAWAIISKETQEAAPIYPRWASQDLFLQHLAAIEYAHLQSGDPDGILVNVGKARQLGLSTELEIIAAHRATTQTALRGLVAADTQEQSSYLFGMFEAIVAKLPWWLRPAAGAYDTGAYWSTLTTDTEFYVAWGKSSRGGLADEKKQKGNIGRGKTHGFAHLSELSTWEKPDQIDDGLMPAIPTRPRTFVGFESTAKGRYDWWHTHWLATARGQTRFTNIFVPWYIEPDKYWAVPPSLSWQPSAETLAHAEAVERDSPSYLFGKTVRLTREQLAWYERTRASFAAKDDLYKFFEEYPANDLEMFQYAGRSIFSANALDRLRRGERRPAAVYCIEPAVEIARLQAWEREEAALTAQRAKAAAFDPTAAPAE